MIYDANGNQILNVHDELIAKKKRIMDELNNKIVEDLYGPQGDIYVVQNGREERRSGQEMDGMKLLADSSGEYLVSLKTITFKGIPVLVNSHIPGDDKNKPPAEGRPSESGGLS